MADHKVGPADEAVPKAAGAEPVRTPGCFPTPAPLRITTTEVPGAVIVRLEGEIDQDQRRRLEEALDAAVARGCPRLVVDMSAVDFCDSTALNALLEARLTANAADIDLLVAGPRPQARRLFEITGADEILNLSTVRAALAGIREKGG
ncbi:STAS domain-containing protein [Kitasatospora sp. NPDC048545]|uniref:STAS domain-containing protein n=1 Tax=Kitasatospora sp. NPDC048545 TaxID=3157208 RepID=UPI0033D4BA41